ncbi:hypothetical protein Q3C19_16110 [Bacteroides sp. ET489]|uniref:hypothetical protein n=1 Tax=Bacteroides sp. ET489 TaxID=3057126 RepID=UPI0026712450|nr:hypothetical protein [Bacteroides sp. ET489]MDO3391984.1 hypothetical protein [Bacteroides sp. ET489]
MKTKHLLFTAAMVSALAACTNDDFVSESSNAIRDDKGLLVELSENFAIAATKGDAETRAYDQNGKFVWVPNAVNPTNGSATAPATLGLCWTGVNNTNPEYSALQTTDYRVFTNYKFEHQGWLYDGETLPKYDACESTPTIKNGQFIPGLGSKAATWETKGKAEDNDLLITPEVTKGNDNFYRKTDVSGDFANTKLNFGTGFFKSKLGTIYQGEYIVYFPYSDEFYNGPVQAVSPKTISLTNLQGKPKENGQVQHDLYTWAAMSKYAFSVGYTANMDGGVDAQSFTTGILSGGVVVRLTNSAEKGLEKPINTITLYSKNEQFILKQNLSAAAIKAANNKKAMYGENFYYGEPTETSKTIVAKVFNVENKGLAPGKDNYVDVVIPVLPTKVDDLTVLMTNDANLTAEYKVAGTTTIKSVGQGWTVVEVDTKNLTFDKVYATDEASFRAATNNVGTSCNKDLAKASSKTVRVLGQIEISDPEQPAIAIRGGYTIVGEEGDALIIKGGNKTNLAGQSGLTNPRFIVNPTSLFNAATMNEPVLDCDVIVESAGCCNAVGGRLVIGQATVGKNANIKVLGHEEGVVPTAAAHYTKDGWLSFDVEGKTSTVNGTIINEGQVTFGRCDRRGTTAKAQTLLNGSITNKKGMTIFYAGNQSNTEDDAKLAVSSTGALNNEANAELTIEGEFFFDGTGYNKGTIYDRVSSQVTGKLSQFKGGEYICDVNDPGKRFNDALLSVYKPTTVVRFVEVGDKVYDFTNYANASETIKKYIVAVGGNKTTYFKGTNITLPAVEVEENNTLNFKSDEKGTTIVWTNLTVDNDLVVNGKIVTEGAGLTTLTYNNGIKNLTVKNNFTVNGEAQLSNETVNVSKTWYVASKTATKSVVTGTTVTVGDATSKAGGLFDIEGVIDLGNNTDILVYGDINAGKDAVATILEATGSASNMPASVTYSGKNTYSNILTNWPKGGPSQMME